MSAKLTALAKLGFATALIAVTTLGPRTAHAQTAANGAAAQGLFDEARKLMSKGRFAEACPKFEESQRLDPGAGTLLNLAVCYERDGRTASAWSTFLEAGTAARTAGNADRARMARERADALEPRLPRLRIQVTSEKTPALEIRRDELVVGAPQWSVAIATDPGTHTVSASAPGYKAWQATVTLRNGATETVVVPELEVVKAPPVAKSTSPAPVERTTLPPVENQNTGGVQRGIGIAVGAAGLVSLGVGTVFAVRSKSAHDDSQAYCDGPACRDELGYQLQIQAIRNGNAATVGLAIGAVGVVTGAILWFTAPRSTTQVGVGPGTVRVAGTW